jgi:hypothetical protein
MSIKHGSNRFSPRGSSEADPSAANTAVAGSLISGVAGRQTNNNNTLTDVGALILPLGTAGFVAAGRVMVLEGIISTTDAGNLTRVDIFNLLTSMVVGAELTTPATAPTLAILDITAAVGAGTLIEDALNTLVVRVAQTSTDAAELAIVDNLSIRVTYP